jgi:hypothetical protein
MAGVAMSRWRTILDALRVPDSFRGNWYGEVTNQAGHAAVIGMPAAMALAPFIPAVWLPVTVAGTYAFVWEFLAQHGADWRDSLTDTANVAAGASIIAGLFYYVPAESFWQVWNTVGLCFAAWLALVGYGVWRRV